MTMLGERYGLLMLAIDGKQLIKDTFSALSQ